MARRRFPWLVTWNDSRVHRFAPAHVAIWSVRAKTEDEALSIAREVTGRDAGSLSVARRLRK